MEWEEVQVASLVEGSKSNITAIRSPTPIRHILRYGSLQYESILHCVLYFA